ncbi:MAG: long-chain-fatty-acid--CoA ligase [Gammaproteobacteria bacterium]
MRALMQDYPLLAHTIIDHAALNHGEREQVTRSVEGPLRRTTLGAMRQRALRVAKALQREGIVKGDRIATLAWNTDRHVEAWYGIMGIGAICHTLNPRLFAEQLIYIVNHAADRIVFVDLTFLPIIEKLAEHLPTLERVIVMTDGAHLPATTLTNAVAYEDWIDGVDDDIAWLRVDENDAAGLCYTSGTTGNPKGVMYSHRSNVLHAMMVNLPDVFGLDSSDAVLPIVPMFHANAWALAFSGPMVGAKMVMPGAGMDGQSIYELLDGEQVSCSAAVPTVWLGLLQYLDKTSSQLPFLKRVVIGGAACPPMMIDRFENDFDVEVIHGWGMTEMSPVGTTGSLKHATRQLDRSEQLKIKEKQGRTPYLVEMKIVDGEGKDLPRDGETFGNLLVRGPAVSSGYYRSDESALTADGWFDTGDVATIDPSGYMQITDRAKDVIKSGGEWISSIEIENVAVGCQGVAEAAVIGRPHTKWSERPLLILVREEGSTVEGDTVLGFLKGKIAKWWMPDDVVFVDELPHTATGKIQKRDLRDQFAEFRFADDQ